MSSSTAPPPLTTIGSKVQVIVRCRPFLSKELLQHEKISSSSSASASTSSSSHIKKSILHISSNQQQIIIGKNKEFIFDHIFSDHTKQQQIFEQYISPLISSCLSGYNATIFAYGQTGSGKTHTMGTSMELISTDEEGIIPRAMRFLFHEIETQLYEKKVVINIRLSFLEIYNEEMRDLLHPEVLSRDISIREDHLGRIFFTGARDEIVTSINDVLKYFAFYSVPHSPHPSLTLSVSLLCLSVYLSVSLSLSSLSLSLALSLSPFLCLFRFLERGTMNRSTGETLMNDASSRSHAIFTVSIEIYESQVRLLLPVSPSPLTVTLSLSQSHRLWTRKNHPLKKVTGIMPLYQTQRRKVRRQKLVLTSTRNFISLILLV
jgi:hypothetical protein